MRDAEPAVSSWVTSCRCSSRLEGSSKPSFRRTMGSTYSVRGGVAEVAAAGGAVFTGRPAQVVPQGSVSTTTAALGGNGLAAAAGCLAACWVAARAAHPACHTWKFAMLLVTCGARRFAQIAARVCAICAAIALPMLPATLPMPPPACDEEPAPATRGVCCCARGGGRSACSCSFNCRRDMPEQTVQMSQSQRSSTAFAVQI